ncbi:hypothetical protein F7725_027362 [Dissostichus mawsoni]|uniref:Uncharacterized protein n=1 Tax=Dissostichus mawsoni TaxID=36200 RepID=A0A7J5XCS3_DISMA|nr:hypothetical protein F7725_027362 [Dissostichus mawsoni]
MVSVKHKIWTIWGGGGGGAEGTHVLVGFEHFALLSCPFGGKLAPLPQSGRRPIRAGVTEVVDLPLHALHALKREHRKTRKQIRLAPVFPNISPPLETDSAEVFADLAASSIPSLIFFPISCFMLSSNSPMKPFLPPPLPRLSPLTYT